MIRELAHAKLHSGEKGIQLSSEEKEFQAEMVAYSTSSYFGIDTNDYSLPYLANWTKGKELKDKEILLSEVKMTSVEFIEAIEQDLLLEKNLQKELINYYVKELNHTEEEARDIVQNNVVDDRWSLAYTTLGDQEELELEVVLDLKNIRLEKNVYGSVVDEKEYLQYDDFEHLFNDLKDALFDELISLNEIDTVELIKKDNELRTDLGLIKERKDVSSKSIIAVENKKIAR